MHTVKQSRRSTYLVTVGIALLLAGCALHTPFDVDNETPVPVAESYISLQKSGAFLTKKGGSAVIIADGVGVTSRHIVESNPDMNGYMADGSMFLINNAILSDRFDLAVFETPCATGKAIQIGQGVEVDDRVYSVGTTLSSTTLAGAVVLTEARMYHEDVEIPEAEVEKTKGKSITQGFIYEGEIAPGFSGGPVVNSHGELVGINQGRVSNFVLNELQTVPHPIKTHGFAYHINDVLNEIQRIAPHLLTRCQ